MKNSKEKINIVFLTDSLADLAGGAERQIFELAKRLNKERYSITIASLESVGQVPPELIHSISCQLETFPVKRIYGLSGILEGFRFIRFLRKSRTNILMTYHFGSDIWGTCMAKIAGVPVIISNRRDMGFWRTRRHIFMYRIVNRWVKKIIVNAEAIKKLIQSEEFLSDKKVSVIYNGIDCLSEIKSNLDIRKELGLTQDDFIFMHVANLRSVKGHSYLLKSFSKAINECSRVKLLLIGEGELREELQGLVKELGIDKNIFFLGKRENIRSLITQADVCLLPSLSEGMSNSILEYMAAGKPVIATNVGGNPELVQDGQTGILVEKENVKQLRDALLCLAKDSVQRKYMGKNGLEKVQREFSMKRMVASYDELFNDSSPSCNIKVLHLISSGGLYGAERVILNIAKNDKNSHSYVGALHNRHNPHLEIINEARKMGLRSVTFDSNGQIDIRTIFAIRKFLKNNTISIIHTHNYKSDILGFLSSWFMNVRWVATNHTWHSTDKKMRFYEKIDAFVLKFCHKVIGVSEEIKDQLLNCQIKNHKIEVISNGIDIERFNKNFSVNGLRSSFGIGNKDLVVIIVGRLSKEKGHEVFLKSAKEVAKKNDRVKFLVLGEGPLRGSLQTLVKEMKMENKFIFAGVRNNMPEIYSISDVFVSSSYVEGLPITLLEAMAARVALIVTPVGAVPKVVPTLVFLPGEFHGQRSVVG